MSSEEVASDDGLTLVADLGDEVWEEGGWKRKPEDDPDADPGPGGFWHFWVSTDNPPAYSHNAWENTALCVLHAGGAMLDDLFDALANGSGRIWVTVDRTVVTCPDCLEWMHA